MRLINDIKLDFKDVLFVPKRSTLFSRTEVHLEKTYTFPNSKYTWTGVPIVVANMDTTGTFKMAQQMAKHKCITCIHKHYNLNQWKDFIIDNHNIMDYFAVSIGVRDHDIEKLNQIMIFNKSLYGDNGIQFICIDVANGYSELFLEKVKYIRSLYPTKTIIAGNVVTNEMTEELIINGVDIIKAGIGGGCLAEDTDVLMADNTFKKIENIQIGDYVLNMHGQPVKVIGTFDKGLKEVCYINDYKGYSKTWITLDHKILVNTNNNEPIWKSVNDIYNNTIQQLNISDCQVMCSYNKNTNKIFKNKDNQIMNKPEHREMRQVYDIMVDCPSHSFIVNKESYIIVHNSVCTTRIKTGIGYPQLSMVIECADAAHGLKGMLMSDGGCTNSGDIAKAFGAGADFVMLGGMMAGHDESDGEIIEENGIKYKEFYGMSSSTAMNKHNDAIAKYRTSEGKRVLIKYKGPVENTINDIMGGIRSTCTYVGAHNLKELSKRTTFIRVTQQSNEIYGKN